ncbi:MAG: hypothetical protein AAF404_21495 [Pseudomonadota bacterium]
MKLLDYLAVLMITGFPPVVAAEPSVDGRLFFNAAERELLEVNSTQTVSPVVADIEEPVPDSGVVTPVTTKIQERISFDGVLVRHDELTGDSAVVWINREQGVPRVWTEQSLAEYRHTVERRNQLLSLKPGQTRLVSFLSDHPGESRE